MNVDYNKHNIVKYLANNKDKDIWKMSVSSIGFQSTKFLDSYPPKGHPFGYTFNPERGRILDEFSLIYITKGRGTFQSGNCSEKKITKGDVFLLFPREWHTYRPAKDIGWNEYFVTFQGEYFNKLLNKIFQPNDPIIHIGINEQIVKHFLEMLDCAKAHIIRKTKCFDFWERNVLFPKTKRSFFRTPTPLPCPFPLNFSLLIITKKFGNLAKNRYICIV